MKHIQHPLRPFAALLLACGLAACTGKGDAAASDADSLQAAAAQTTAEPYRTPGTYASEHITCGGVEYNVALTLETDRSLPTVSDEFDEFYDNRAHIVITRGEEVVSDRVYTKEAFIDFLTPGERKEAILDGINLLRSEATARSIAVALNVGRPADDVRKTFLLRIPLDGGTPDVTLMPDEVDGNAPENFSL